MPLETKREIVKILRERHQFENEQMHKRLSWLGSFQSFLFAGLCLAWGKNKVEPLIFVVALLGLVTAILSIFALSGVGMSLVKMQKYWNRKKLDQITDLGLFGVFQGSKVSYLRIFPWPEVLIPFAFSLAWGVVLYVKCLRYLVHNILWP